MGRGTPIPFDPPKTLVTTGPYAYVSNPMQITICMLLATLALAYGSIEIMGASIMAFIFSIGFVRWHQNHDIALRFGADWKAYKDNVRNWVPRWKPYFKEPAMVFFERSCDICSDTEKTIHRLNPVSLSFQGRKDHPSGALRRVTYRHPDGTEEQGIVAIARCLEHVNLAWAFIGWFMRLPVISSFLQVLIDGVGQRAR